VPHAQEVTLPIRINGFNGDFRTGLCLDSPFKIVSHSRLLFDNESRNCRYSRETSHSGQESVRLFFGTFKSQCYHWQQPER
jgi:hypothetical protein